jgi:hypothetical protein
MRASRILPALLLLTALPAAAQKVYIDYDSASAFSEFKTYQIKETPHDLSQPNELLHRRTVAQLTDYLESGGLEQAENDPDVYVAYYVAYLGDLKLTLTDLEYTYGPGFSLGAYWKGGTGTREISKKPLTFKEGSVIVDVWDRERKVLIWRGIASAKVAKNRGKNSETLDRALKKLLKQWGEMHGDHVRAIREIKKAQQP